MKKLFSLLLALVMVLSLAACGGKDDEKTPSGNSDTPQSSQQQEQQPSNTPDPAPSADEPDESGEDVEVEAVDWPTADYISESMEYTGTGTIVYVSDEQTRGSIEVTEYIYVKINGSSLEDVGNYIAKLKENGFEYFAPDASSQEEPALEFWGFVDDYKFFEWRGQDADGHYLDIELLEETKDDYWVDSDWNEHPFSYNLTIILYSRNYYAD